MDARLNLFGNQVTAKTLRHINSAGKVSTDSPLPPATQELVKLRASQINGCGFCTDMHTKEAAAAGESTVRLHLVAAWREATVFTEAERAALELTEGHPDRGRGRRGHGRGVGGRRPALRRGPARRPGVAHRRHQRLQPAQRPRPPAGRRLHPRTVRLTDTAGPVRPPLQSGP
jgi:AhpD family alkylhydroperoxidase